MVRITRKLIGCVDYYHSDSKSLYFWKTITCCRQDECKVMTPFTVFLKVLRVGMMCGKFHAVIPPLIQTLYKLCNRRYVRGDIFPSSMGPYTGTQTATIKLLFFFAGGGDRGGRREVKEMQRDTFEHSKLVYILI